MLRESRSFLVLFLGFAMSCSHSSVSLGRPLASQDSPAGSIAEPWALYETNLHHTSRSPYFAEQDERVDTFVCSKELETSSAMYLSQRNAFLGGAGSSEFPHLAWKARQSLQSLFPLDLKGLKELAGRPELAAKDAALLMAKFARETRMDPFLDEAQPGEGMLRGGAGLIQISAWSEEKQKLWGPHDYDLFNEARAKNSSTQGALGFVPARLRINTLKSQIQTHQDFLESPYNPVASIWYGKIHAVNDSMNQMSAAGIPGSSFSDTDRAAVVGAIYNGGIARLRCSIERLKKWNASESAHLSPSWQNLRRFLYLDTSILLASGFSQRQVHLLKQACGSLSSTECSCLDQEEKSKSKPSRLEGKDFKAAVMISYGNHLSKLLGCYESL